MRSGRWLVLLASLATLGAGCTDSAEDARPTTTLPEPLRLPAPPPTPVESTTTTTVVLPPIGWVAPVEGARRVALYLRIIPDLETTERTVEKDGFGASAADLHCDEGAYEALGLDPDDTYTGVALYFTERAEAERFAAEQGMENPQIAEVTSYCAPAPD